MQWNRRHLLLSALGMFGCGRTTPPAPMLPDFGRLPDFRLRDQAGRTFASTDFAGRVWILDFIFTRCTSVCPRMTSEMRKLQDHVAGIPQARLVSVSIDPEHDTSNVLAGYAARFSADTTRWSFLTGEKNTIRAMQVKTQRHLDPDEITAHSKQFYLVDANAYVRGVYSLNQPGAVNDLLADLKHLIANPSKPEPGVS